MSRSIKSAKLPSARERTRLEADGNLARAPTLEGLIVRSEQFDIALKHMPHGLCMFDRNINLLLCNPAYARLYALPRELTERGVPLRRILEFRQLLGNGPCDLEHYFDVVQVARETGAFASRRVALTDGRTIQMTHNPMPDGGYVATHEDVTGYVLAEQQRHFLASHDVLTGLLNRGAFLLALEECLAGFSSGLFALHLLDLDSFKPVNDTFGHQAGDLVLQTAASRLSLISRNSPVYRLGGDEFAVLSEMEGAAALAKCFIEAVQDPTEVRSIPVEIGVSIGIAAVERGLSSEELFHRADVALYKSKMSGGNRVTLFKAGMTMP